MPEQIPGDAPPAVRPRILVFYDYACPFCFVDLFRFLKLEREMDVELFPVPYELRPHIPPEGISAAEHELTHSERVEQHLLRLAADEGERMTLPDHLPNTHGAMTMSEVARDAGPDVHRRTHLAIFRAYYSEGADIGEPDVLLGIAKGIDGLDATAVKSALDGATMDDRLAGFRHVASHLGIDATPAALICNELLVGSRTYQVMKESVERCLVTPRSIASD